MLWIVSTFPVWVFHAVLILGIVLLVLTTITGNFPGLAVYSAQFKLIGLALVVAGLLLEGASSLHKDYLVKEAELQHQVDVANAKAPEITTKVVTQIVYRDRIITKQSEASNQFIKDNAAQIDHGCVLSKAAVDGFNKNLEAPK